MKEKITRAELRRLAKAKGLEAAFIDREGWAHRQVVIIGPSTWVVARLFVDRTETWADAYRRAKAVLDAEPTPKAKKGGRRGKE